MAKSGGYFKKFMSAIGLESIEDEQNYLEDTVEEEEEEVQEPISHREERAERQSRRERTERVREREEEQPTAFTSRRRNNVINMPDMNRSEGASRMTMKIIQPNTYEETRAVIDHLKSRKPVVMNIDEIDIKLAQRILDFVSGAVYALGGDIQKVARNIYAVAPSNVVLSTELEDEQNEYTEDRESYIQ